MCLCVLTGLRTEQYERIMRWWSSPAILVPTLASSRGCFPTQASPVSVLAYPPTAQGHFPTEAYPVSVPES